MFRLLRNYSIENGTETTVDDILQHFNDDKENSQCTTVPSARRIGIEIKELFVDSVETKRKSKGNKKIRVHQNLCKKLFVPKILQEVLIVMDGYYKTNVKMKMNSVLTGLKQF